MTDLALGPGAYADIPHAVYDADPCERPSLRVSIAKLLLDRSPLHAYMAHPRLGHHPIAPDEDTGVKERGSILHALILGTGAELELVEGFDDWRKKEAQQRRDAARAEGKIPVLRRQLDAYQAAVEAHRGVVPADTERELTLVWESGPVLCRARLDAFDGASYTIHDPKTCDDAKATASGATMVRFGRDIQAAAYMEAVEACFPEAAGRVRMLFHCLEVAPPYDRVTCEAAGSLLELGNRRWRRAVDLWHRCTEAQRWPGADLGVSVLRVEAPPWALSQDMEQQLQRMGNSNAILDLDGAPV